MNILLLLGGSSEMFAKAGNAYPKSLIEVAGEPIIGKVIRCVAPLIDNGARLIAVVRGDDNAAYHLGDVIRLIVPAAHVVEMDGSTGGAACTALLAIEHIDNDQPLIITNGDQLFDVDLAEVVKGFAARQLDGGTITFRGLHPRWSFVRLDKDGFVEEAAEKRPISRSATAGFYYFARGRDFVSAASSMIRKGAHTDGGYYVCPSFNEMILKGARIGVTEIQASQYHSLASPTLVEAYEALLYARGRGA